ncbi:MAG TPA: extracellular solute-binding protein [Candidatus Methylomirabilis sp.]|nr:extracellular solute-binding protein [Candidatus Methylomirabilis sp.]
MRSSLTCQGMLGVATFLLLAGVGQAGAATPAALDTWLKQAEMGPYQEAKFDADALYQKAKGEGKVTVYSYSSRIVEVAKTFEQRYPGVKVQGFDMDSAEIVTKVQAEQSARNYAADVVYMKDPATALNVLKAPGHLVNYVPGDLVPLLRPEHREPFLIHHLSFDVLIYNAAGQAKAPVSSLWDLTKPEWQGRVLFPDPQVLPEFTEVLATIVQHSPEMAKEYERVFGKPLQLSPGVPDAGREWIKRLLANKATVARSTNDVAKAVGRAEPTKAPIGLTAMSRLRDKEKDPKLQFDIAYDLQPVGAVTTGVLLAIPSYATHPSAAKLLIRWLMGDAKGGEGYTPYFVLGDAPTRLDQPLPSGMRAIDRRWYADPAYVWANGRAILDFWVANLK